MQVWSTGAGEWLGKESIRNITWLIRFLLCRQPEQAVLGHRRTRAEPAFLF